MARLRLKQAGVRSFMDVLRILFSLIASKCLPRQARDRTFVIEQASPQRVNHAGARPCRDCLRILQGLIKGELFQDGFGDAPLAYRIWAVCD